MRTLEKLPNSVIISNGITTIYSKDGDIMYANLEHLSSLEVDKIKKRYYNGESVAKLIAEYQLNIATT